MNSFLLMILLIVLNVNSLIYSENLVSYRGLALGNIIADDLDLIYDPIELQFVEGVRVYTNLSNATSGEEKLFGNISDDQFLFGISAEGPFLNFIHHSFLIKFQKSEIPNSISIDSDLDGYNDSYGTGSLTNEYNAFYDSNGDGIFDLRQIISQNKSDITKNDDYSFILNNSFELWFFSMGVKLSVGDFQNSGNTSSVPLGSANSVLLGSNIGNPTFEKSLSSFLLDIGEGENNFLLTENGDFQTINKSNFSRIDVSGMFEIGDFEMRGDASFSSDKNESEINNMYSGRYDYFEIDSIDYEDYYSESDSYLSLTEEDGSTIGYGGSLKYIFNYQDERKNDGFWKIGFSMGLGTFDYNASILSNFNNEARYNGSFYDEDIEVSTENSNEISDKGTKSITSYALNLSLNIPINDDVHFGIGASVSHNETSRMTLYNEEINNRLVNASTDTAIDNYTITENYALVADRNHDISETRYIFPTGLEYRIGQQNQFSLRVGSIFELFSLSIKDTKEINESEPFTWIKEYSDGTLEQYMDDNIFESTSEVSKTTISSTVFTYGFGFNPTNNLQIDLLGVFNSDGSILDTDFYKSLQISFTLKFD